MRVGKTREKLAELLQALSDELFGKGHFYVFADQISQNQLTYRSGMEGGISWEVYVQDDRKTPRRARFYSWCTMGDCCKHGVAVVGNPDHMNDIEVCADEKA